MYKLGFLSIALLALHVFPIRGLSAEVSPPPQAAPSFADSVRSATRVARIRILAVAPQYIGGHDPGTDNVQICGHVLTAKTLESFKGAGGQFDFFVPGGGRIDANADYLAVVFSHSPLSDDQRLAVMGLSDFSLWPLVNRQICMLRHANYVPLHYHTLWQFDPTAAKQWSGEWLLSAPGRDGLFCGYQAKDVHPRHIDMRNRQSAGRGTFAIGWEPIRRQIREVLAGKDTGRYGMCDRIFAPDFSPPE